MYFKKGFTLAEILIVLTIIGVMAVMTIPSLIQNSNSQQKIALFKKGFNAISNAYATEFALKSAPNSNEDSQKEKMWDALNNQLNVKFYYDYDYDKKIYSLEDVKKLSPYARRVIVTEDGLGYRVLMSSSSECNKRLIGNSYKSTDISKYCINVAIMADGIYSKKKAVYCNDIENGDKQNLSKLKCNSLTVHVTKDGITAGNPDCTIAGRIMSDNVEYDATKCQEENP